MLEVNIQLLGEKAVVPTYSKVGDAGLDITATSKSYDEDGNVVYGTQLAFEIPEGYVGLLFPRSSNAKKDLILSNSVGVLDSNYRGEVMFKFKNSKPEYILSEVYDGLDDYRGYSVKMRYATYCEYAVGDRIGQIIILPIPQVTFNVVDKLSDTKRGTGGFGSSGA